MNQESVLVVGASGSVGAQLTKNLLAKGITVKEATSQKGSLGPRQVRLNLVTGEGIHDAFENVERVFLLSPPGYADQYKLLSPLVQESKRRGLKRVVLMTAMGVDANEAAPFRRVELELEKSGLQYNIIRPNWFYQNFHTFWLSGILNFKKILLPAGNAKVSFIDARDIADVTTELLVNDKWSNQAFDLTGEQSLDHYQVAAKISEVTHQSIQYQEITNDEFKAGLLKAGLSAEYSDFLVLIMGFLKEGYSARVTDNVRKITGRPARTINEYLNDYKNNWKF